METKLVVVGGKANRQEIRLKLPATLGRGRDADLTVAHPLVSRLHCRLEEVDGALVLRDNNSTNGTFVGKAQITEVVLKPGDQFTVGPLTFKAVYEHAGAFPSLGKPAVEDDAADGFDLPPSGEQGSSGDDFTVAFDPKPTAKAKPAAKPAAKSKAPPAETKPAAKSATKPAAKSESKPAAKSAGTTPAEKKPAPKAKPEPAQPPAAAATSGGDFDTMDWLADDIPSAPIVEPEPIAAAPTKAKPPEKHDALPPAADTEAEVLDWLDEPAAAPQVKPPADIGFDEEPMAVEATAEAAPVEAEELDALPPTADDEAEVLDWLEEPAAAPVEPLVDIGFDDEPRADEAPAEAAPVEAEELDALSPPAADEEAEVLDWLEAPAAAAPVEPPADIGFDEEPMAVEAPAEAAPVEAEELDALSPPAADEEAEVLDWLEEPAAAAAPQVESLVDIGFDDEPRADEAQAEAAPVEAEELDALPPAADEEAEVLDWLEAPAAAAAPQVESLVDIGFDDEPRADEAPAEAAPVEAEELDALSPPAADEEAEVLDWLEAPAAAGPVEPLAGIGFDDEAMAIEATADAAPVEAEELDALPPPAADEEAEVLDWLEEPAAAPVEPLADIGFDEEPMASEAPAEAAPVEAEELDALPPAADEEAEVLDWLEAPAAAAPVEPPADIGFDEEPMAVEAPAEAAPVEAEELDALSPPAADEEAEVLDWLEEPAAAAAPQVESLVDIGFDDEPRADEAPAEAAPVEAEELDALPPAADEEAEVLDWLEAPAAAAAPQVESLVDIGFDDEPRADEAPAEAAPVEAEELDALSPPAADEEAEVLDWLEAPAAAAPVEPPADIGFDEEPMAVEAPAEAAPVEAEELDAPSTPAADDEADVLDWLEEPAAAPQVEPPADIGFDEEPMASEARAEAAPVEAEELDALPPTADDEAEVLDWLEEPAAAPQVEPPADIGFDEEPMASKARAEAAPVEAEERDALPPTADDEAEVLDWLEEPAAAPVEPLADIGFDEEPMASEPTADEAPAEAAPVEAGELDALPPPAADADAEVLDWLEAPMASEAPAEAAPAQDEELDALSPVADEEAEVLDWLEEPPAAAAPVEPLANLGFDNEPTAVEAPAEAAPAQAEEVDALSPPAADEEAGVPDWVEEPAAAAVPPEPLAGVGFDTVPMESAEADEVTLPTAGADEDVFGWLEEPAASVPPATAESPGEIGIFAEEPVAFDEQPVAAEPDVDFNMAEEPVAAETLPENNDEITLPATDADADALDWLAGPSTNAPQAEPKPLAVFDEELVAAEPHIEDAAPVEPAELMPPAAEADDNFIDWLDEPAPRAAHSEVESPESLSFDEEPVPAEPLADITAAEEPVAADTLPEGTDEITLPAAEADDDFMNWLEAPAAAEPLAEAEPLGNIESGEVPVAAEPLVDAAPVEPAEFMPPAAEADDNFIDWLDEPAPRGAHSEVESPESLSFDEEPVPAVPLADLSEAEEPVPAEALPEAAIIEEPPVEPPVAEEAELIASPSADAEAGVLDWLAEPAASDGPTEAEPLVDFGLDEVPVAAEPLDAAPATLETAPTTPPLAEDDEMTAFWPGEAPAADPQLEDQASGEFDFDFGSEPAPDAALADLPMQADEPMFMDEDAVAATPALPDEAQDLELDFGAGQEAADLTATEMFVAADDEESQPALAEPVGFSDDEAFDSLNGPTEAFEVAETNGAEEASEIDFLAGADPIPAATSEFEVPEPPEILPPVSSASADRRESAAEKAAKKSWWPFGKSKKEKLEKKAKPEPKDRKAAAAKKPELDPIPMPAVESEPLAASEEFAAPIAPQAAAEADGMPDFSFADSGHEAPAKSGGDDDLEDFFQDLGLK